MDQKLHQFVALLHRPMTGVSRRRARTHSRGRRAYVIAATAAIVGSIAVGLWLAWPTLSRWLWHSSRDELLDGATVTSTETLPRAETPTLATAAPQAATPPAQIAAPPSQTAIPPSAGTAHSGTPAWQRFAVPAVAQDGRARVAIIIDDMGLDRARSDRVAALPGPLTLSYLAYARDLPQQSAIAHRSGHELMVHVPMEPTGRMIAADPNQLDIGMSREEVLNRLRWDLSRFEGYVGINNHMGSRFTAEPSAMRPVLEELKARGLLFIDSRTTGNSAGVDVARELGVASAARDVFLDYDPSIAAVEQQFAELERIARRNGSAIAIGHPHDQTLEVLQRWLRELPQKGIALVPVSAIVRESGSRELARDSTGVIR